MLVLDPVRSKPLSRAVEAQDAVPFSTWEGLAAFLVSEESSKTWRCILRSQDEADYASALSAAKYLRHVDLFVDEGFWFCSSVELRGLLVHVARANSHFGDGIGVPLWITAQRPMDLPPDIRSQADCVISFRQEEPRDLAFLSERCSPEFAESVAELGTHKWAIYPPSMNRSGTDEGTPRPVLGDGVGSRAVGSVPDVPQNQLHIQASARSLTAARTRKEA